MQSADNANSSQSAFILHLTTLAITTIHFLPSPVSLWKVPITAATVIPE